MQQQHFLTVRGPDDAIPRSWTGELVAQTADAHGAATRSHVHAVFVVDGAETGVPPSSQDRRRSLQTCGEVVGAGVWTVIYSTLKFRIASESTVTVAR